MEYSFANADDEVEIKQFLAGSDLLHEDIATDQLKHFRFVRDGSRLAAVVGLEKD